MHEFGSATHNCGRRCDVVRSSQTTRPSFALARPAGISSAARTALGTHTGASGALGLWPCVLPLRPQRSAGPRTLSVTPPRVTAANASVAATEAALAFRRPNTHDDQGRLCVKSLALDELRDWFQAQGERPSRADQLWRWIYSRNTSAVGCSAGPLAGGGNTSNSHSGQLVVHATPSVHGTAAPPPLKTQPHHHQQQQPCAYESYHGGGLRRLEEAGGQAVVDGFSAGFVERFGPLLTLDGGLALQEVVPAADGTRKLVFRVTGGEAAGGRIETVLIPWYRDFDRRKQLQERPRYTLCVSSQVGCAMNCQFCFTGRRGLLGNLSTAQIIEQVLVAQQLLHREAQQQPASPTTAFPTTIAGSNSAFSTSSSSAAASSFSPTQPPQPQPRPQQSQQAPPPITNLVFMGMGEPLHNATAVFAAIDILTHRHGLAMSPSRVTLSTVGLLPQLQHFLDRFGPPPAQPTHEGAAPASASASSVAAGGEAAAAASRHSPLSAAPQQQPQHGGQAEQAGQEPTRSSRGEGGRARVCLAVSIHAGTDELRGAIVPSNTRLSLPPAGFSPSNNTSVSSSSSSSSSSGSSSGSSGSDGNSTASLGRGLRWEVEAAGATAAADVADGVGAASAATATGGAATATGGAATATGGAATATGGGNRLHGLAALSAVLSRHYPRTDKRPLRAGRYVLFEYTLLRGVNDRPEDAAALLEATKDIECSFNLIMFNPFPGTLYSPSTPERLLAFQKVLWAAGRIVHVRLSKGDDGMAACGQLGDVGPQAEARPGAKLLPEAKKLAAAAAAAAAEAVLV